MAGWRIGYCVGNSKIIEGLGKIKRYFDYGIFSAIEIMNRANVAVATGVGFSEEGEGYLRLALVEKEERLRQGLRQIKRALPEMASEL